MLNSLFWPGGLPKRIMAIHCERGVRMGCIIEIWCDNCSFSARTANNLTMLVYDYYDEMYCLRCQEVVGVWRWKDGREMVEKCPQCGSHDVFYKRILKDYYDEMYCLRCQEVVGVWRWKDGKEMVEKCPQCGSHDVFYRPDGFRCPKCKKGNLKIGILCLTD